MRRSQGRSTYQQRKRRGRKSNLYTRNRPNDPEPWAGTPPQTPPSSDDEGGNENMLPQRHNRRSSKPLCESTNVMRSPYKVNANYSMTMRSAVAPAPSQHQQHQQQQQQHHRGHGHHYQQQDHGYRSQKHAQMPMQMTMQMNMTNNQRRPLKTISNVKRNISKYVKMENANVLQSRKYSSKQTKLNHIKTAPVPRPRQQEIKKRSSRQTAPVPLPPHLITAKLNKLKNMKQQQKQLKSLKSFRRQKQTAPAPPPPHKRKTTGAAKPKSKHTKPAKKRVNVTANAPINPNIMAIAKKKKQILAIASTMNMNAKPFIINSSDSNSSGSNHSIEPIPAPKPKPQLQAEELVDIRLIPDAYFIGNDEEISALTFNSKIKQIDLEKDIDAILNFDVCIGTKASDAKAAADASKKQQPRLETADSVATTCDSNDSGEIRMYSPVSDTPANGPLADCSYNILSDFTNSEHSQMKLEESEDEKKNLKQDCDFFFNDDKFTLLAEQILDEKCEYPPARITRQKPEMNAMNAKKLEIDQIFADAGGYQAKSKQQQQLSSKQSRSCSFYSNAKNNIWAEPSSERKNQFISRSTLSGLLSSGLPPISTTQLFQ